MRLREKGSAASSVKDSGSFPVAPPKVEHFARSERTARGKAARAEVPRRVPATGSGRRSVQTRSICSRSRRTRVSPSSFRSDMAGCWLRRLRFTVVAR
jgi:hypothetical protein